MLRAGALVLCGLSACGTPTTGGLDASSGDLATAAAGDGGAYPAGPYGFAVGDVIANLQLPGRRGSEKTGPYTSTAPTTTISLGDYYGKANVLVISLAAQWCTPCQAEQPSLVQLYTGYQTSNSGVAFLEAVTQKIDMSPADQATVDSWTNTFKLTFDMVSDPVGSLAPLGAPSTYPDVAVIDASSMSIRYEAAGDDPDGLKAQIELALGH